MFNCCVLLPWSCDFFINFMYFETFDDIPVRVANAFHVTRCWNITAACYFIDTFPSYGYCFINKTRGFISFVCWYVACFLNIVSTFSDLL